MATKDIVEIVTVFMAQLNLNDWDEENALEAYMIRQPGLPDGDGYDESIMLIPRHTALVEKIIKTFGDSIYLQERDRYYLQDRGHQLS